MDGCLFWFAFPDHADAFDPLLVGNEEEADIARSGCDFSDGLGVFVLLLEADARSSIDAELNHDESVIQKVVAKLGSGTALGVGHDGQIKHGE